MVALGILMCELDESPVREAIKFARINDNYYIVRVKFENIKDSDDICVHCEKCCIEKSRHGCLHFVQHYSGRHSLPDYVMDRIIFYKKIIEP